MSNKAKSPDKLSLESPMEQLEIGGALYETRLTKKFRNRENWSRPDERKVEAVIPGTIQRIMVSEGEEVSPGTPMLILEAMKMRNEVVSPIQGIIRKIYVSEGDQVPKAQLLVEIT
jgi:biotin carboxyl carrier protein